MHQTSTCLSVLACMRTGTSPVSGLQWRLKETTHGKGSEQHWGHRRSSIMWAALTVFPFTTPTVARTQYSIDLLLVLTAPQLCHVGITDEKTKAQRGEVTKARSGARTQSEQCELGPTNFFLPQHPVSLSKPVSRVKHLLCTCMPLWVLQDRTAGVRRPPRGPGWEERMRLYNPKVPSLLL